MSNAATSGFIGDIGTNAGAITGIQTGATTHVGKIYPPGPIAAQAAQDLSSAYNQLMAIQSTDLGHIPLFGNAETNACKYFKFPHYTVSNTTDSTQNFFLA